MYEDITMKMSDCFQILFFDEILVLFGLHWCFQHISPVASDLHYGKGNLFHPCHKKPDPFQNRPGPFL